MTNLPLTILIADDDLEDLELVEDAIIKQDSSVRIHKLTSGQAVLDYLAQRDSEDLPCLIVLDYNMRELNGSQVLAQIGREERYNGIPKIIFSTSNTSAYIHECLKNGAAEYLVKPNNMKDLVALASKMLNWCTKKV
jgi:CheY-like chemotaxis protein